MAASVGYNSAPRSLTISPNLEALLEHDEKIRQLKMVDVPIFGGDAVAQWSTVSVVGDVVDYGLPPPPRRRRPATAPNSPASDGGRLWSTSSPTSSAQSPTLFFTRSPGAAAPTSSTSDNNPFINPAPSQEDLRRMHRPAPLPPRPSSFTGAYTDRRPEARSQLAGSSLSPPPPPPPHRPVMRVPTHVPHTSLPEKLEGGHGLGIATGSETSGHPAGHRKTESEPAVQQMKTTVTQTPFRLRERARLKGKLLKLKGTSCNRLRALSEDSPLQAQAIQGVTLTYEEPGKSRELEIVSLDINSSAAGIPRRPGVGSHARRHKSSPSVGSGSSTLDRGALSPHALTVTAAHSPLPAAVHDANTPFTIDPRSVIDTPAQPTMPGDARTQSRRQSGQSFIDFSPVFEDAPALDLQSRPEKTAARQAISPLDIPSQAEPAVSRSASLKPPLPTAPKPTFHRALSVSRSANRSKSASRPEDNMLPPTTNNLSAEERAGLIRRNRKLERILGQPAVAQKANDTLRNPSPSSGHQRGAISLTAQELDALKTPTSANWPPAEGAQTLTMSGRRHSTPLSPDDFQFLRDINDDSRTPTSRLSFMDFSDDEVEKPSRSTRRDRTASIRSIAETVSAQDMEEEERRRKRDRLAKLHRYLGSRVPPSLVLGSDHPSANITPVDDTPGESSITMPWQGRKSSSSSMSPSSSSENFERVRENLDYEEKAINVRRAQKMQQMFGVAPPQTLYHTRHSPSPSLPSRPQLAGTVQHENQTPKTPFDAVPPPLGHRNPNRGPYMRRKYSNADSDDQMQRPGSPESSTHLIPKSSRNSVVYTNYEASINSLNDILDRDDRASLAELHQYLLDDRAPASPGVGKRTSTSSAGSRKSERRRSLPVQAALEATSPTMSEMEKPDVTDFQWRRRKAAKLTQFFGVNHREVIDEVLNSFEHGLEFERDRGNIDIEEAEDLLRKIRHIKSKRSSVT